MDPTARARRLESKPDVAGAALETMYVALLFLRW